MDITKKLLTDCRLCPRNCGADRWKGKGYCGVGAEVKIARAALHMWEEPCISGKEGSGAVLWAAITVRTEVFQEESGEKQSPWRSWRRL